MLDIVMKNAQHTLPERFAWHRSPTGYALRLDEVLIAEVASSDGGLV
ncbi:hypothetical protein L4O69_006525, partial [Pseudomonas aeruginosa]|nr:hypothetical protein [Pseudomonas aeruginosa]EIU4783320.1 hypothetical protein [Pseudomonas aeruginosa]EIU4804092.1 hypothetical protein [Pseudomonas aeruginosa]EKU4108522.1 hypothetical protein [Pseudomonas aeruginosa]EKX4407745.1 hypothetical protein [Pseudomonas aeruginosa]